jgi:HEAT repeat protein
MPIFNFSRRPNVQELKAEQDIDGLIEALDFESDHNVRQSAAWALGELASTQAVDPLLKALDDTKMVREVAAKSLGEIGDPRAVKPLLNKLKDQNWEVRGTTARALGKIGDHKAIDGLIETLKDENASVRWYASQALETITGESLGDDPDEWARWHEQHH